MMFYIQLYLNIKLDLMAIQLKHGSLGLIMEAIT